MKRFFVILMIIGMACMAGCNKNEEQQKVVSLMDGSILIKSHPSVKITSKNEWVVSNAAIPALKQSTIFPRTLKMGTKALIEYDENSELRADHYRFKLVAEMGTLIVDGFEAQATCVKLSDDGYAFVTYNYRGKTANRGGVVVYKYTIKDGSLEDAKVIVTAVQSMEMSNAQLNAVDYYNGKLYLAGANEETKWGYDVADEGSNTAFFMVVKLNSDKTFNETDPEKIQQLTSFQATFIRAMHDKIYVTFGDGTRVGKGGLKIFDANNYDELKFIEAKYARSVDVDASNVYLMQAEDRSEDGARVTKYDLNGNLVKELYNVKGEAKQPEARSDMIVWDNFLFVSLNESGLRMLNKNDGSVIDDIILPSDWDTKEHVTNSVFMNSDPKKNLYNKVVNTNLLFSANGEKGIYWHEIMKKDGKDIMVPAISNSALGGKGLSSNFIASKGNVVFVANGLGGLKVLYMGATKDPDWDCTQAFSAISYLRGQGTADGENRVGEIVFQAEGENLCVYITATKNGVNLKNIGCLLATNWASICDTKVVDPSKGDKPEDWKISTDVMKDYNKQYRTTVSTNPAQVKFTFPKTFLEAIGAKFGDLDQLICIIYGSDGWGNGIPTSPSGTTGNTVNNSMYFFLGDINYCEPIKH